MSFTVEWLESAENRLTILWLGSRLRQAMTTAADRIEESLQVRPQGLGESRDDGVRILLVWPLGVYYRIFEAERRVVVLDVWQI